MPFELIYFVNPPNTTGKLQLDNGTLALSHPAMFQNRRGIGFTVPDGTENGHGCELTLIPPAPDRVTVPQRGILWLRVPDFAYPWIAEQSAALAPDDMTLPLVPLSPLTPPDHQPNPNLSPLMLIKQVEATGLYDLTTKEGCGAFTEACCTVLHNEHSHEWGHVRKTGAQNQYNGHAVDALMLKISTPNTPAAIYDIIVNSEAPGATAALNFSSTVNPILWYYPA